MLAVLLVAALQAPALARAESLLAAGSAYEAARAAERIVARRPADGSAHLLLGRAHFARPIVGRYPALAAFRAAARLAPGDPVPLHWQMQVGLYLGSDEGDRIAREAILGLLALAPDYADAWDRLQELYQGPDVWRRAERALARHGDHPLALERRAALLIALEEPARAESLLAHAARAHPPGITGYLRRAEAAFVAGRDTNGYAWYDSAVAHADRDSAGALWGEAWVIASGEEAARYAVTPAPARRAFFESFWGRRDPDLTTMANERLAEHYRRRATARRLYRLLHPQRLVYRSTFARARAAAESREERLALARRVPAAFPGGGGSRPEAAVSRAALLALPARRLQETALPLAFRAGVDARGLLFLRHGAPDAQLACVPDPLYPLPLPDCVSALDVEGWVYHTPTGPVSVGFTNGGEYLYPVSPSQVRAAWGLLASDRTAVPAPLDVQGWTAFFPSGRPGRTAVYARAGPGHAAAALWDSAGVVVARAAGPGVLALTLAPGSYDFGLDIDSAGVRGRLRSRVTVPAFGAGLRVSSLALAAADTIADREAALDLMPPSLAYAAGAPLAVYAEVHGLTADPSGRVRYRVRYTFAPRRSVLARLFGGPSPVELEFVRDAPAALRLPERIVIEPGRLPQGRYRVALAVTDLTQNVKAASSAVDFVLR